MAGLQRSLPEFERRKASIVALSVEPAAESAGLRKRLGLRFPLLHDADAAVAAAYGVRMANESLAIPAVFVVDRMGQIEWSHVGESVPDRPTPEAVLAALDRVKKSERAPLR